MRPFALLTVCLLLTGPCALAADETVTLVKGEQSVKVMIGEDVFTVYRFGTDRRKPFFQPVTGPGGFELLKQAVATEPAGSQGRKVFVASESAPLGTSQGTGRSVHYGEILEIGKIEGDRLWIAGQDSWIKRSDVAPLAAIVTRLINDDPKPIKDRMSPDYYDHPHHKGIWFSVDEINDIKFWMEDSLVTSQSVEVSPASGHHPATMKIVNHWLDKANQPVLREATTVTFFPNRGLIYDATLSPAGAEVHIGDTKEGMFAIRLPNSMREFAGGGPVTNADGLEGTKAAWGRTSNWVNYDGPVDGHVFGVTLMDFAQNPWKSRYHVRDYGLFAVNPFGAGAYTSGTDDAQPPHARTLKQGESLRFRYGAWIHGPDVSSDQINRIYARFQMAAE